VHQQGLGIQQTGFYFILGMCAKDSISLLNVNTLHIFHLRRRNS